MNKARENCPICVKKLKYETRPQEVEYKGHTHQYQLEAGWCDNCNEGFPTGEGSDHIDRTIAEFRAKVDGFLTPSQIKAIRKRLRFSQAGLAELIGGGPNALSRYEKGQARPVKGVDNLLRLLDKHPELVNEIMDND